MPTKAKRPGNSRKNPRSKPVSNAVQDAVPDTAPEQLLVNDPADPVGNDVPGYEQQAELPFNADAAREAVEGAFNSVNETEPESAGKPESADKPESEPVAPGKRATAEPATAEVTSPSKRAKASAKPDAAADAAAADNKSDAADAAAADNKSDATDEAAATLSTEPTAEAADAADDCVVETAGVSIGTVVKNQELYSQLSPLFTGKEFKAADDATRERVTAIIVEFGLDPASCLQVFYVLFWSWTNYIYTREKTPRKIDAILAEPTSQLLFAQPCFHLSEKLLSATVAGGGRLRDEFVAAFAPGVAESTTRGHVLRLVDNVLGLMRESGVVDTSKFDKGWEARLEAHTKRDARGGRKPGVPNGVSNDKSPASSKPRGKPGKVRVGVARATFKNLKKFFPAFIAAVEANKAIKIDEFEATVLLLTRCEFEVSVPEGGLSLMRVKAAADALREIESPSPDVERALAKLDAELARMEPVLELLHMEGKRLEETKVETAVDFAVCLGQHVVLNKFKKLPVGLARLLLNPAAMRDMMELKPTTLVKNLGQDTVSWAEAMLRAVAADNIDFDEVLAEELAEEIGDEQVTAVDVLAKFGPVFGVAVNTDSPEATAKAIADLSNKVDEFTARWAQLFRSREPESTAKKVHKLGIGAARARAAAVAE